MKTENIYLRATEKGDINFLYNLENDIELWKYGAVFQPISKDEIERFVIRSMKYDIYTMRQLRFIICRNDDNSRVGCIDITDFNPKNMRASIGIVILKSDRNKGYADESLKLVTKYCFNILNLKQLYCEIDSKNIISQNLFTNNGFCLSGIKKQWIIAENGVWHDILFYQNINEQIHE